MEYFPIILLSIAMTISVIEDIRRWKIPNWITFPTMIAAIAYHSFLTGLDGFFFSCSGLMTGIGLFIIPYLMGGMGAGDAKLVGAAGAVLGPKGIMLASLMVILIGGLYGMILFIANPASGASFLKRLWSTFKTFVFTLRFIYIPPGKEERQPVLRYAIPIAMGTLMYVAFEARGFDLFSHLFRSFSARF